MTLHDAARQRVMALSDAFAARDPDAALACFTTAEDIAYVGSEAGEAAYGRIAVRALFAEVFRRPEAYSWTLLDIRVHAGDGVAHVLADATGCTTPDVGDASDFPYRLSGLLECDAGTWRWRVCVGSEPEVPATT